MPPVEAGESPGFSGYRVILRTGSAPSMVLTTLLVVATQFIVYGVAAAYLSARFRTTNSEIALILLAFGVLGVIGNAVASRTFRALGGGRTVGLTLVGLAIAFAGLTITPALVGVALVLFGFWAFFSQLYQAPQQARLVELLPDHRAILLALNASTMYVGVSLGSFLGSTLLPTIGAQALTGVALVPLACAVTAHVVSIRQAGTAQSRVALSSSTTTTTARSSR